VENDSCGVPHALQTSVRHRTRGPIARCIFRLQGRAVGIERSRTCRPIVSNALTAEEFAAAAGSAAGPEIVDVPSDKASRTAPWSRHWSGREVAEAAWCAVFTLVTQIGS
jgi:hypothetical protein